MCHFSLCSRVTHSTHGHRQQFWPGFCGCIGRISLANGYSKLAAVQVSDQDLISFRVFQLTKFPYISALPGIVASKFGAKVILSDSCILPNTLKHINRCCEANNLESGRDIQVMGLSWGILLKSVFDIGPLDYIIAADCFYDPTVFEDILVTISFLLGNGETRGTKFLFTYQERSADWSIEHLLAKWNLQCSNVCLRDVEDYCPLEMDQLMNGHTIRLMEVTRLR